jgi:hypothetical protein
MHCGQPMLLKIWSCYLQCRLYLRYFAALITYLYAHWDIYQISSHTSPHIVSLSKHFTFANWQNNQVLSVGLIRLWCCELKNRGNPPIRIMLWVFGKGYICVSWLGFVRGRRWPFTINCQIIQINEPLPTRIASSYPAGDMDICLLSVLSVSR